MKRGEILQRGTESSSSQGVINVRKVITLDIALHGTKFILAEFAFGAFILGPIAIVELFFGVTAPKHPLFLLIMGGILLGIALNSLTLLLVALDVTSRKRATKTRIEREHIGKTTLIFSLLILLPLILPIITVYQVLRGRDG